jgi:hypothetical protein
MLNGLLVKTSHLSSRHSTQMALKRMQALKKDRAISERRLQVKKLVQSSQAQ